MRAMTWAPLTVLLMLTALVGIALHHARRVRTGEDFALAGRGLGAGVLVGTLVATWIGTGSILGNAEFTYENGVVAFLLPVSGLAGMLLLARLAPRLRRFGVATVPEVLGRSFGVGAQRLGAIALVGAYLIIVSYQYRAGAAMAERLFPGLAWSAEAWSVAVAVFVILFTALAGLLSVAWTDVAAGLVILVGVVGGLVWLGLVGEGGEGAGLPASHLRVGGHLNAVGWVNVLLPSFLLILGDANLMQRFLAAEDPPTARRAAIGAFFGLLLVESAVIGLALLGRSALGPDLANPAHVVLETAFHLVPPILGLGLVTAIVAVILSTADSYLLASSTCLVEDLLPGDKTVRRHRLVVLLLGLIALGLAFTSDRFFSVALYAYTLYGVTITPAFLAALLDLAVPRLAVVAGMTAGLVSALGWKAADELGILAALAENPGWGWLKEVDAVLPALAVNAAVVVLVGWLARQRRVT